MTSNSSSASQRICAMESPSNTRRAKPCLPRLSTYKSICRRDSLSSSRTRDSGYNSDLDSLSPLDVFGPEQDVLFAPLPPVPDTFCPVIIFSATRPIALDGLQLREEPRSVQPYASDKIDTLSHPLALTTSTTKSTKNCSSHDADIENWIKKNLPHRTIPKERLSSIASLSSTSSCDMYTNTDISGDEADTERSHILPPIPHPTLKIIELILRKIETQLTFATYTQCTQGRGTSSNNYNRSSVAQSTTANTSNSSSPNHKRKARRDNSLPPDDDDVNDSNKRRRGSAVTTDDSEAGIRFACPFYKHDPDRYRNRRTCPGPGWTTVHRMKEHLYRSHAQPIFCPICYSIFKSDREQLDHVRLQQCERSAPQQIDGIDRETIWTLRKRTTALRLEEDKWRDAYHVLFPEVGLEDIPSPFYDCDSPSETSRRFRRELLRRVQDELFTTATHSPDPVEQQLLNRVARIIRRCEQDILNPQASPGLAPMATTDRRPSYASDISTMPEQVTPLPAPTPSHGGMRASYDENGDWGTDTDPSMGKDTAVDGMTGVTQNAVEFNPVMWLEPVDNSIFSTGIDWELIFPEGSGELGFGR